MEQHQLQPRDGSWIARPMLAAIVFAFVVALAASGCGAPTDTEAPSSRAANVPPSLAALIPDWFAGVRLAKEPISVDEIAFIPEFAEGAGASSEDAEVIRLKNEGLSAELPSFVARVPGLEPAELRRTLSTIMGSRTVVIAGKQVQRHGESIYHYVVDDIWLMLSTDHRAGAVAFLAQMP